MIRWCRMRIMLSIRRWPRLFLGGFVYELSSSMSPGFYLELPHKNTLCTSLDSTKNPCTFKHASAIILAVTKSSFVLFHNGSRASDGLWSISWLTHGRWCVDSISFQIVLKVGAEEVTAESVLWVYQFLEDLILGLPSKSRILRYVQRHMVYGLHLMFLPSGISKLVVWDCTLLAVHKTQTTLVQEKLDGFKIIVSRFEAVK